MRRRAPPRSASPRPVVGDEVAMTNRPVALLDRRPAAPLGRRPSARPQRLRRPRARRCRLPAPTRLRPVGGGAALEGEPLALLGPGHRASASSGLLSYARRVRVPVVGEGGHATLSRRRRPARSASSTGCGDQLGHVSAERGALRRRPRQPVPRRQLRSLGRTADGADCGRRSPARARRQRRRVRGRGGRALLRIPRRLRRRPRADARRAAAASSSPAASCRALGDLHRPVAVPPALRGQRAGSGRTSRRSPRGSSSTRRRSAALRGADAALDAPARSSAPVAIGAD